MLPQGVVVTQFLGLDTLNDPLSTIDQVVQVGAGRGANAIMRVARERPRQV
jgi:hypothetical protein